MSDAKAKKFWEEHIKNWSKKGISQAEYCRQNKLNQDTFSKWKMKIGKRVDNSFVESANNFIEVKIPETTDESEIELVVKDIFKLKLKPDFNSRLLKDVLKIIGEIQ